MLKNYLKIAWRNLRKNKIDSAISIGGLAVGIACCLLLVAYVQFEWSFDNFHKKGDRLYRVYYHSERAEGNGNYVSTPYPLAEAIEAAIPEVKQAVRYRFDGVNILINGKYRMQRAYLTEAEFFNLFSFNLIAGDAKTALDKPNSLVITRGKALQLFGSFKVLGKTVQLRTRGNEKLFTITGVMADIPDNSSIIFDVMLPYMNSLIPPRKEFMTNWYVSNGGTFVMLKKNAKASEIDPKLQVILKNNVMERLAKTEQIHLLPFNDFHLSSMSAHYQRSGNPMYAWILACLAVIILAIAAINFMSLTLSRASLRVNEIGLRKTIGATPGKLINQFMGEAFLTCILAFILAGVLFELVMPLFQQLVEKPVMLDLFSNLVIMGVLVALLLLTSFITGGYPAFVLSRKKGATAFISHTTSGKIPAFVKALIVVQFIFAIGFLSVAFIMNSQLNFMADKDLGYSSSDIISIEYYLRNENSKHTAMVFSREARRIAGVENVALTSGGYNLSLINGGSMASMHSSSTFEVFRKDGIISETVGKDYLETMDIKLKEGSNFTEASSKNDIIINQKFAEVMGWKNPVGQIIHDMPENGNWKAPMNNKRVIGVVGNYNFQSLYKKLKPVVLQPIYSTNRNPHTILIEFQEGKVQQVLAGLSSLWDELLPQAPFNYDFMDGLLAKQYKTDRKWFTIMTLASALAIMLACFGLFGLASMAVRRRTKEIGIRKVFGATLSNITTLLSKDFIKLVLIGFVIAVPVALYFMNQWLQDFAYRIDIGVGIFLLAGGLALFIALATVSWQSIRAALANPVDSLRSE